MARGSTPAEQAAFLRMVVSKTESYHLLKIWDGRYAAFWSAGYEIEHCSAVAAHKIDPKTAWPFAFVHTDKATVLAYIAASERGELDDGYA